MGMTAFALDALISLDDSKFQKGLSGAEKKMSSFGKKLGSIAGKVGKVTAAAAAAAAAVTGKILMDSVNAYAEYEQLVGGVETLFGTGGRSLEEYQKQIGITEKSTQAEINKSIEDYTRLETAQEIVMENAHKAFKTAGMDANTYMATVTSFSASLLQSLGGDTVKAAAYADMAITDMSDNANKMGSDMTAIENAYQGFAKQNYTMLDNLKLGYGGTKQEMERLLQDAEKITGKKYDISNLADIFEAIHVIQTEIGITGTTAKEAEHTIQGSTNMMKAAWKNLKVAMVSPDGNIPQAIDDLTYSVRTAAGNWMPAIKRGLSGISQVIKDLAPIIAEELPGLINDIAPDLISAIATLIPAVIDGLTQVIPAVAAALPGVLKQLIDAVPGVLKSLWEGVKEVAKGILIFTFGEDENGGIKWPTPEEMWEKIKDGFTKLWNGVREMLISVADWALGQLNLPSIGEIAEKIRSWWAQVKADVGQLMLDIGTNLFGPNRDANAAYYEDLNLRAARGDRDALAELARSSAGGATKDYDYNSDANHNAKGAWDIPYDDYLTRLHRGEMVLSASQARRYREGEGGGIDFGALTAAIVGAVRQGMDGAQVNSYLDGQRLTDEISRIMANELTARRFA